MGLETEAIAMLQQILQMDDKVLENGYDDLVKLFDASGNFEQAIIEKTAYCRANNLTIDDLIEENMIANEKFPEEFGELSPIKQKFLGYLMSSASRINDKIMEKGLHPVVKVRVERLPHNEKLPAYIHEVGDSGLDVFTTENVILAPRSIQLIKLGFKVAIPVGYELQVRPRSGISGKPEYFDMIIPNSPGTIDANYRNEVMVLVKNLGETPIALVKGMRFAQLVLAPVIKLDWVEVPDISAFPSERKGGFGHTGDK